VKLCPEEMERDLPGAVAQAQGEVLAGVERALAGWGARARGLVRVGTVSAPNVEPGCPIRQERPVTI
jgi:hypothetical protein